MPTQVPERSLDAVGAVITLDGTLNTRAIADLPTADGRRIRPGLLYRSSALRYLTDEDQQTLRRLDIRTVIDFRGPAERAQAPDRLPAGIVSISAPISQDQLDFDKIFRMLERDGLSPLMRDRERVDAHGPFYRMYSLVNSYGDPSFLPKLTGYKPMLNLLLDPEREGAILIHCTGGRDRTGIATAILLRILGVPEQIIVANYLASNHLLQPDRDNPDSTAFRRFTFSNVYIQPTTNREFAKVAAELGETPGRIYDVVRLRVACLTALWANIARGYGSFENFLATAYGLTEADTDRLKDLMTVSPLRKGTQ